jgi:hypothetical protein
MKSWPSDRTASGWYILARLLYAVLISVGDAVRLTRSTSYRLDGLRVAVAVAESTSVNAQTEETLHLRLLNLRAVVGILRGDLTGENWVFSGEKQRGFPAGRVRVPNIVKRERVFRGRVEYSKIRLRLD